MIAVSGDACQTHLFTSFSEEHILSDVIFVKVRPPAFVSWCVSYTSRQEVSDKNVLYTAAIRDTELVY